MEMMVNYADTRKIPDCADVSACRQLFLRGFRRNLIENSSGPRMEGIVEGIKRKPDKNYGSLLLFTDTAIDER